MDLLLQLARRYVPWLIVDLLVAVLAFYIAFSARFVGSVDPRSIEYLTTLHWLVLPIALAYCLGNYLFGIYRRMWSHETAEEVVLIFEAVGTTTMVLGLWDVFWTTRRPLPISVVVLGGFFAGVAFATVRYREGLVQKLLHQGERLVGIPPNRGARRRRVLIIGAGQAGHLLVSRFQKQKEGQEYDLLGFVDDDPAKQGMRILGLDVLGGRESIPELVSRYDIDLIVIAIYNISGQNFRDIISLCEETPARIKVLPNLLAVMNKSAPLLRDVTLEDLLGRKPVQVDLDACRGLLAGKSILVTGAAGSIGSELCRQIITFEPGQLLVLDNNESGLHDLVVTLRHDETDYSVSARSGDQYITPILADITNQAKMRTVFASYRPQIVFHAAAYKHVPLMETHPDEAVRVNILGTWIVMDLAIQHGAERFVLVSTDKAVNPHSVMGATKRIGEMMIAMEGARIRHQRLLVNDESETDKLRSSPLLTAVRFGNVWGSRGSVIPTFQRQIEQGGPVTVTHPEMTRYFMSIPEAASLIIQAATLTDGGDLFMLDMGQRIRIDDLARRLIRLRGLRPDVDIPIIYTGPRPGEKLHEELLGIEETREPTSHPHILRIRNGKLGTCKLRSATLESLIDLAAHQRNGDVVTRLRELVGECGRST